MKNAFLPERRNEWKKLRRMTCLGRAMYLAILLGLLAFGLPQRGEGAFAVDAVSTGSGTGSPIEVTHTVTFNNTTDSVGVNPENGICAAARSVCTLKAVIQK